jgi:hypothetical protein
VKLSWELVATVSPDREPIDLPMVPVVDEASSAIDPDEGISAIALAAIASFARNRTA